VNIQTLILLGQETQPAAGGAGGLPAWAPWLFQIVNFLILVLLLRVFLFKRVVRAMDRREKKIASHFEEAERAEAEAREQANALQQEREQLDSKRDGMLQAARAEAEKLRTQLSDEARKQVGHQAAQWREQLAREKESFLAGIRQHAGRQVTAIAKRALADLADAQLEQHIVRVLLQRLADLDDEDRRKLAELLADAQDTLTVATAWETPEADRNRITEAIRKHVARDVKTVFEAAPELTCGIELRVGGREVSWTIDSYVQGIRDEMAAAVDAQLARLPQGDGEPSEPAKPRSAPKRKRPGKKGPDDA
jgi:F-type H+-transporting ATPase subunit b